VKRRDNSSVSCGPRRTPPRATRRRCCVPARAQGAAPGDRGQAAPRASSCGFLLGQLAADPRLTEHPVGGTRAGCARRPRRRCPAAPGSPPWCLTDPAGRSRWQADPRAVRAIELLWAYDPDPAATLTVQAEIDAALRDRHDRHLHPPRRQAPGPPTTAARGGAPLRSAPTGAHRPDPTARHGAVRVRRERGGDGRGRRVRAPDRAPVRSTPPTRSTTATPEGDGD